MEWLTICINPPELGRVIVARSSDDFGYGATHELFTFERDKTTSECAAEYLISNGFVEWLGL